MNIERVRELNEGVSESSHRGGRLRFVKKNQGESGIRLTITRLPSGERPDRQITLSYNLDAPCGHKMSDCKKKEFDPQGRLTAKSWAHYDHRRGVRLEFFREEFDPLAGQCLCRFGEERNWKSGRREFTSEERFNREGQPIFLREESFYDDGIQPVIRFSLSTRGDGREFSRKELFAPDGQVCSWEEEERSYGLRERLLFSISRRINPATGRLVSLEIVQPVAVGVGEPTIRKISIGSRDEEMASPFRTFRVLERKEITRADGTYPFPEERELVKSEPSGEVLYTLVKELDPETGRLLSLQVIQTPVKGDTSTFIKEISFPED